MQTLIHLALALSMSFVLCAHSLLHKYAQMLSHETYGAGCKP